MGTPCRDRQFKHQVIFPVGQDGAPQIVDFMERRDSAQTTDENLNIRKIQHQNIRVALEDVFVLQQQRN